MSYYVVQVKRDGISGSNYVYGPFSREEAEKLKAARLELYSSQYDVFIVMRLL